MPPSSHSCLKHTRAASLTTVLSARAVSATCLTSVTDKGFSCHYDFHEVGAQQAVPPKKHAVNEKDIVASAHGRLTTDEVEDTKDIAAVRVFVEHAVRRMKEFRIFASVHPMAGSELLSMVGFVVMCLVNVTTTTIDLFPKPKARDEQ